jgi:hypothetical protein
MNPVLLSSVEAGLSPRDWKVVKLIVIPNGRKAEELLLLTLHSHFRTCELAHNILVVLLEDVNQSFAFSALHLQGIHAGFDDPDLNLLFSARNRRLYLCLSQGA